MTPNWETLAFMGNAAIFPWLAKREIATARCGSGLTHSVWHPVALFFQRCVGRPGARSSQKMFAKTRATRSLEWGNPGPPGRRSKSLKWYYHCRPSLAMIVDFSVLPGLCFQSLATFYCRFHCRPLNQFVLSVSHQTRRLWPFFVEHKTKRMKRTVGSEYGLRCEQAQWSCKT